MKRPWVITFWAVIFAIGAMYDIGMAVMAYIVAQQDYSTLNPGPLAFFRPIAWIGFCLVPFGLWALRRWAVVLYTVLQVSGVAVTYLAKPAWLESYPSWAMPLSLVIPGIFLLTVLPYWRDMK
jgi:hypothetical protein